jgi:hypothetical protein
MRVLLLNLTLIIIGVGAAAGCRADDLATLQTAFGKRSDSILCASYWVYPCQSTLLPTPHIASMYGTKWQRMNFDPQLNIGDDVNATWQMLTPRASDRDMTFRVDSMGAGLDTSMGRLAFNLTLDKYYHGGLYNNQDLFQPFQLSVNYGFAW